MRALSLDSACRQAKGRGRLPKILVIDDDQNLRRMMKVNLAARGYQVLVAPNGEKGLEQARLERPDLIFLDLMMPGISGWDVLVTLQADRKLSKTPVIIMTASGREDEENKARSMRAAGYLVKPFGVDELMRQVKLTLGSET